MNGTTTDHGGDIRAIERIVSDIEAGFNIKDPDLSVGHFAENATAVSVAGTLLSGRDALLDAERTGPTPRLERVLTLQTFVWWSVTAQETNVSLEVVL